MEKIGLEAVFQDANFLQGIKTYISSVKEAEGATEAAARQITKETAGLGKSWQEAAKEVGVASAAMGAALTALAVKTTLTAARTEELGIVLRNVAKNAGVSAESLDRQVEEIKELGITTQVANQLLIQFMRYQLDTAQATELARLAQDAAVIAMQDSSQALEGILHGIVTYNVRVLRTYGIVVNLQQAFEDYAHSMDMAAQDLTAMQKQQVALNEVLKSGDSIAGTYEAAMTSAGKQLRSMKRHVEESANAFGQYLLPVMGKVVEAGTDLLKWMQALDPATQATVAQVGALVGVLATAGGALAFAVPKILSLITALQALGGMAVLGPIGAVTALVTLGIHLKNIEEAHIAEAAAIFEASANYTEYIIKIKAAGLAAYALAESLYDTAKAAQESGEAIDAIELTKAQDAVKEMVKHLYETNKMQMAWTQNVMGTADAVDVFDKGLEELLEGLSDTEKQVLTDEKVMQDLALSMGMVGVEAQNFARHVVEVATEIERQRWEADLMASAAANMSDTYTILDEELTKNAYLLKETGDAAGMTEEELEELNDTLEDVAESTGLTRAEIVKLAGTMDPEGIRIWADAWLAAQERLEDFFGAVVSGINDLNDIDAKMAQTAEDYEKGLADIQREAAEKLGDVKEKFEDSLPDPTTVRERTDMVADAWDEWALRLDAIMNGIQTDQERGWFDFLKEFTAGTDLAFKEGEESLADWARRVKDAFYAGDLPGLINTSAKAGQEHSATIAQAMADETAAITAAQAEQTAALKAAQEERQAALEAEMAERRIAVALAIAEATGLLQEWATATFGPEMAGAFDTVQRVLDALKAGVIDLEDTGLDNLLNVILADFETMKQEADATAADVNEKMAAIGTDPGIQDAIQEYENLSDAIADAIETEQPVEDIQALVDKLDDLVENVPELKEMQPLISALQAVKRQIDRMPDKYDLDVAEKGGQGVLDMLSDIQLAIDNLTKEVVIQISAAYNAQSPETHTKSPRFALQDAVENLVEVVESNFPLNLAMGVDFTGWLLETGHIVSPMEQILDTIERTTDALEALVDSVLAIIAYRGGILPAMERFASDYVAAMTILAEAIAIGWDELIRLIQAGIIGNLNQPELGSILGVLADAAETLQLMAEYAGLGEEGAERFYEDMIHVLTSIGKLSAAFPEVSWWAKFMGHIGVIGEALSYMAKGMGALAEIGDMPAGRVEQFAENLGEMLAGLQAITAEMDEEALATAAALAATVGIVGAALEESVGGLQALATYGGLGADALAAFARDLPLMIAMMKSAADQFPEGVEAAEVFADGVGKIAKDVGSAVDGLAKLATYRGMGDYPQAIGRFTEDVVALASALNVAAAELGMDEVNRLLAVGEMLDALGKGTKSAIEAMVHIAGYRGGVEQGLQQFINDVLALAEAWQQVGDAIPPSLLPGSPSPLERSLRGIASAMQSVPLALPPGAVTHNRTMNLSMTNYVNGEIGLARLEATILDTVGRAMRDG